MKLDLLGDNVLIIVCMGFTLVSCYVLFNLYKYIPNTKPRLSKKQKIYLTKVNRVQFLLCVLASFIVSFILTAIISKSTDSPLPVSFVLMCLPLTFLVSLFAWSLFFKKKYQLVSGLAIAAGLIFSLIIINDYFRYYPLLGEVFGDTDIATLGNHATVTVNYTDKVSQATFNQQSIQGSFKNLSGDASNGQVFAINIPGTVSGFKARQSFIYLPAIYNSPAQLRLPVIVLTAGVPGSPNDWVDLGLQGIMNQFAKAHNGIAPIIVVADSTGSFNNDTECVNSSRGNAETYLSVDVPNYIKSHFRVDTASKNWAIGGLSLGGMCSIMLTLRHTNVYHFFIDLGGEAGPEDGDEQATISSLFNGSETDWAAHQPYLLLQRNKYPGVGGFFGDGEQDNRAVINAISQLGQESKAAGLDTVTEIIEGHHTFNVWIQTYKLALPWISNRLGATSCTSSCL